MNTDSPALDQTLPTDAERAAFRLADCRRLPGRLKGVARERAALDAQEARDLVDAQDIEIWSAFGYTTMLAYLEGELGYGPHTACERLRVARALLELPLTAAQLAAGALHYSAVRELTRVATAETEAAWLAAADGKNLRQLERMVAGRDHGDLPDDDADPDLAPYRVTITMSPAIYALYRQTRQHLDQSTGERLSEDAAIEMMCRAALEPAGRSGDRPAAQIAYTLCPRCERATQDGAGIVVEVDPATAERVRCDAEIIGDVSAATPSRVTTTVTPRARRQVLARDHHRCAVPGCRHARYLEIHHLRFQSAGGKHESSNLLCMCTAHHSLLHQGKLIIHGTATDLTFLRVTDDGERIELRDASHVGRRAMIPQRGNPHNEAISCARATQRS